MQPLSPRVQEMFTNVAANLQGLEGCDIRVDVTVEEEFDSPGSNAQTPVHEQNIRIVQDNNVLLDMRDSSANAPPVRTLGMPRSTPSHKFILPPTPPRHAAGSRSNKSSLASRPSLPQQQIGSAKRNVLMRNFGTGNPGEVPEARGALMRPAGTHSFLRMKISF